MKPPIYSHILWPGRDFQVAQRRQVQDQRAEERRAMYWCMMPAEGAPGGT